MPLSFTDTKVNNRKNFIFKPRISNNEALDFISSGVACFALTLLDSLNLLDKIEEKGHLTTKDFAAFDKKTIQGALKQLFKHNILTKDEETWKFTYFGEKLLQYKGIIQLIYNGYSKVLSKQTDKALSDLDLSSEINYSGIAKGSDYLGDDFIDKIALHELDLLGFEGAICDLGCGDASRLIKACEYLNIPGLGIELSKDGIKLAKENLNSVPYNIQVSQGDATKIQGCYEEIEVATQFFVLHDFAPVKNITKILNSYLTNFPNLKYFVYCDTVSMGAKSTESHPGFDYIHNLLGIEPMSYEDTIRMFEKSKFSIKKEVPIHNLPNTYIWILEPKNRQGKL